MRSGLRCIAVLVRNMICLKAHPFWLQELYQVLKSRSKCKKSDNLCGLY